ncbi:hypothetical protein GCM10027275_34630 [Rhabdobacter roseus]|uniref:Peptidase M56 domain-containing protein n=1 Tax=Rhabdobacter roseus TaxID=1655419 RepID=A0A840TQW8_9BACT|nr:M56 family metallopeptidase [Rhabdobacter roseus]MBB5285315.1 hypothetical protein [Rhabdobacter roseus]
MYLFPYLLKVSVTLALLTVGYRWLVRRETFSGLNRSLLWINVLAAWLLPWVPLAHWGPAQVQQQVQRVAPWPVLESTLISEKTLATSQVPLPHYQPAPASTSVLAWVGTWGWSEWLLALYLLGAGTLLLRLLMGTLGLARRLRQLPFERTTDGLRLVADPRTAAPYSFFRWVVYNPEAHSRQELAEILTHEAEHARQWHSLDLLLAEVLRALLWFNPVAWWHQRLVEENLEYLADRAVLGQGFEKKHYQHHLLKMALQAQEVPFTHSFAQTTLKKRIRMMNRRPSSWRAAGRYALLLGVLYGSSALVAPYRARIVQFAPPVVRPIVEAALPAAEPEKKTDEVSVPEKVPQLKVESTFTPTKLEAQEEVISPYCVMRNDTIFWIITPLISMDELMTIRETIRKNNGDFFIDELKYDSQRAFLESMRFSVIENGGGGASSGSKAEANEPIEGTAALYSTGVRAVGRNLSLPSQLREKMKSDYEEALKRKETNRMKYLVERIKAEVIKNNFGEKPSMGGSNFTITEEWIKEQKAKGFSERLGMGIKEDGTLRIGERLRNALFFKNDQPSTFEAINKIPYADAYEVMIYTKYNPEQDFVIVFMKE